MIEITDQVMLYIYVLYLLALVIKLNLRNI